MPARKFWRAAAFVIPSGTILELSEIQLYSAGARVDAAATLTSDRAPDSGTLASLKDNSTATGAYWNSPGVDSPALTWEFPTAQAVDAVLLGARTTAARFPLSLVLQGGPALGTWDVTLGFGGIWFASAAKVGPIAPGIATLAPQPMRALRSFDGLGGNGRVRGTVKEKHTPSNVPVFRRVRLIRERDGLVIRETWSDPTTGAYDFQRIDEAEAYTVLSYDHTHNMQAVANDNLSVANGVVELMP